MKEILTIVALNVPNLDYWTALWFQLLISFIPLTIHTYSKVYYIK